MPQYTYHIGQTHHTWMVSNRIPEADESGRLLFSAEQQETHRILLEMLAFWMQVAGEHRITWFAVAGTLLGAVRNHGIIPFDDDIDLGVSIEDYPTLANLATLDLHPAYGIFLTEGCGARVYQRNGARTPAIDLWIVGLDDIDRRYVYAGPMTSNGEPTYFLSHTFPKEWVEARDVRPSALKWVAFEHLSIPVPRHARQIVQRVYGRDCLTLYRPCPHLSLAHRAMDALPLESLQNASEWLFLRIMKLDYGQLNLIFQLIANGVRLDTSPVATARHLCANHRADAPKRAFRPVR